MKIIDLRSDTVTLPTETMRTAIYKAELGDDVFGEDATVNRLEEMAAAKVGKEAALLVVSGTMGNLVSILTHCHRGDEVILGDLSHTFLYECGGISALGGIHPHTVKNQLDGTIQLDDISSAIRGKDVHFPRSRLICLENTHNRCEGAVLTPEYTNAVAKLAKRFGLLVHLDGARIFNAAVALKVDVKELTQGVDSVTICLSKGLSAPVGSLVCGTREFIAEARRVRKMLGGGMRQAGIIAASGIVALEEMVGRLEEDHKNARLLAEGLTSTRGLKVDLRRVQTNMVYVELADETSEAGHLVSELNRRGTKVLSVGPRRIRIVTHYGISAEDINVTLGVFREVMEECQSR
jgi:threonine aldolase